LVAPTYQKNLALCYLFNGHNSKNVINLAWPGRFTGTLNANANFVSDSKFGRVLQSTSVANAGFTVTGLSSIATATATTPWTFETWINMPTAAANYTIYNIDSDRTELFTNGAPVKFSVNDNNDAVQFLSTTTLASATWYHVVVTYDGATITLYLNGVSDGSHALATSSMTTLTQLGVGCEQGTGSFGLVGSIGLFRYWQGRALKPSEIAQLYNQPYANVVTPTNRFLNGRESFNPVNGKISTILAPGVGRQSVTPVAGKLSNLNATGVGRESVNPVVGRISLLSAAGVGRESISAVLGKVGLVSLVGAGRESFNPLTGKVTIVNAAGAGRQSVTPVAGKLATGSFTGVGRQTITPLVTKQGTFVLPGVGTFKGTTGQAIIQLTGLLNAAGVGRQSVTPLVTKQGKLLSTGAAGSVVNPLVRKQAIVNMAAAGLVQIKAVTGKVAQVNAIGSGRQSANPFVIKSSSARLTGTGSTTVKVLVIKPGKINLTGAGRFSARPGGTAVIIPIVIATIARTPNPAAIIVQTLKPGARIVQTARPVAVITRTDYPAQIVQSSRPTATIVKD
jgi:hypothetical protein